MKLQYIVPCLGFICGAFAAEDEVIVLPGGDTIQVGNGRKGNHQYITHFSTDRRDVHFATTLTGSYCGDCIETLPHTVRCREFFSVSHNDLYHKLQRAQAGDTLFEQLKVTKKTALPVTEHFVCSAFTVGYEDVPVELQDKGPACDYPYKDYNDYFFEAITCKALPKEPEPEPEPEPIPEVSLEITNAFGYALPTAANGIDITEQGKCGSGSTDYYNARMVGSGSDVWEAQQEATWKIYHQRRNKRTFYEHSNSDPDDWAGTPTPGHVLLRTARNQAREVIPDCTGKFKCYFSLPCDYGSRGILTVALTLKDGRVFLKRFSRNHGKWRARSSD